MKGHPIGRDTWLLGYEPAFELKQVQAFVQVIKDMLDQENPFKDSEVLSFFIYLLTMKIIII